MSWLTLAKDIGPYLALMFFFIWRDYRREEHLVKQIDALNKFISSQLMDCIEKTTEALRHVKS